MAGLLDRFRAAWGALKGQRFSGGAGSWYPRLNTRTNIDYGREVGDPVGNSIVAACLGWIVDEWPQAPIYLAKNVGGKDKPLWEHPLLQLLKRPNPWYGSRVLWEATLTDLLIDGNGFWHVLRGEFDLPVAVYWMSAASVQPKRNNEGDLSAYIDYYEYTPSGGKPERLETTDVVHFRIGIDPLDSRKGRSRFRACLSEVYTDNEAASTVNNILRNRAQPGLSFSPKTLTSANGSQIVQPVTLEQAKEIEAKINAKFTGDGKGSTIVHTIPMDINQFGAMLSDIASRELRRIPEERICAIFKIPPGVVKMGAGLDRNTMSNADKEEEQAWRHGIIPLQGICGDTLDHQLLWQLEPRYEKYAVKFDISGIGAMQEDANVLSERVRGEWKDDLITHDVAISELGYNADPNREGKYYSQLVGVSTDPTEPEEPDTEPETPEP